MATEKFRVGLAPGFLDLDGRLRFKDIGLDLLESLFEKSEIALEKGLFWGKCP